MSENPGSKSVLLVEDNELNQKLMYFNMKKLGFKMTSVNNGLEAVEACKNEKYDFILMDLMMPVMDGYEATKKIRNNESSRGTKSFIIGLTGNVYDSDRERCLEAGMDEFISKPFDSDKFLQILHDKNLI